MSTSTSTQRRHGSPHPAATARARLLREAAVGPRAMAAELRLLHGAHAAALATQPA